MVASILSKKLAAGATHLVIDMPVGPTAKVRSEAQAVKLRKLFEYVAGQLGMVIEVIITDGSQPVGRGIGPVLEARDVMQVLHCEAGAPADLREHALLLAGRLLEHDPALPGGAGLARATELLDSGAALAAMHRLIRAQGPPPQVAVLGSLVHDIAASATGRVIAIDCHRIARIARIAGAPMDKGAGIDLFCKVGADVAVGQPLYRIHAASPAGLAYARDLAGEANGYTVAA
jgi:thymidine phosphorylase